MGRLLDKLKRGAPAYDVKVERDGFTLIGKPDHIDEFSDLVREAANRAGEEFVVYWPDPDTATSRRRAEALRAGIGGLRGGLPTPVTASACAR